MKGTRRILIYSAAVRMDKGVDLNLGDEALSDCLAVAIQAKLENADVHRLVSVRGENVELAPKEHSLRNISVLIGEIRRSDVVVLGGGTLFQDDPGILRWMVLISTIARALRKPVVIASVGVEGLQGTTLKWMSKYVCARSSRITVRDYASGVVIKRASGKDAEVAADPVLLVHSLLKHMRFDQTLVDKRSGDSVIAVNLTREAPQDFVDSLAERLADSISNGATVLGVAMDRRPERDGSALKRLGQALGWPAAYSVLSSESTWRETCAVLAECDVCIGMRLHFLLLSSIVSAPVLAVTTLPKTMAFAVEFDTAHIGVNASSAELQDAMSQAHAPRAEVLQTMGARAVTTIENIATEASRPNK